MSRQPGGCSARTDGADHRRGEVAAAQLHTHRTGREAHAISASRPSSSNRERLTVFQLRFLARQFCRSNTRRLRFIFTSSIVIPPSALTHLGLTVLHRLRNTLQSDGFSPTRRHPVRHASMSGFKRRDGPVECLTASTSRRAKLAACARVGFSESKRACTHHPLRHLYAPSPSLMSPARAASATARARPRQRSAFCSQMPRTDVKISVISPTTSSSTSAE